MIINHCIQQATEQFKTHSQLGSGPKDRGLWINDILLPRWTWSFFSWCL